MKITADILAYVAGKTGVKQAELLEKDMLLHLLLKELTADQHFRTHYVFKGGTCLIKCYLGYYRFSEDLDFSYTRQEEFKGKSEKQIRRKLSEEINNLAKKLEAIATRLGLEFKAEKQNHHYMEFGGGNKFTTFKLWYKSVELRARQFIKIQINYVEKFKYPFKQIEVKSVLSGLEEREIKFRHPQATHLLEPLTVQAYDIREILAEKVRAILTRRGMKARDYVDIYMIWEHAGFKPDDMEDMILEKTEFMLRYEKYRRNLLKKVEEEPEYRLGEEERLLIKPLDKEFLHKTRELEKLVRELAKQLV